MQKRVVVQNIFRFQREVLYETGGMLVYVFHDVISEKEIKLLKSKAELQVLLYTIAYNISSFV